jgi:hypothetical protein
MRRKISAGAVLLALLVSVTACNLGTTSPTPMVGASTPTSEPTIEIPTETETALVPPTVAPTAMPPGNV